MAILRHIARLYGKYGTTEDEQVECDFKADCVLDWRLKFNTVGYSPNFFRDVSARYRFKVSRRK